MLNRLVVVYIVSIAGCEVLFMAIGLKPGHGFIVATVPFVCKLVEMAWGNRKKD